MFGWRNSFSRSWFCRSLSSFFKNPDIYKTLELTKKEKEKINENKVYSNQKNNQANL